MYHDRTFAQVDREIARCIESYSDEFWASTDRNPRDGVHGYFRYPAMMVPAILRELIRALCRVQPSISNVVDPFLGAGTTMTASMGLGLNFAGQDINPLAVLISRAKAGPYFHRALQDKADRALEAINSDKGEQVEVSFDGIDKWFPADTQVELSRIRRAVQGERALWTRRFLWVALGETVRLTSNTRTSTYKLHTRPRNEIESRRLSALGTFSDVLRRNLDDLVAFRDALGEAGQLRRGHYAGQVSVHLADSARAAVPCTRGAKGFELLVTSPPYGDNTSTVPYGQHSYLPLQWVDLADIDARAAKGDWLRSTQEIDRRSLGGKTPQDVDDAIRRLCGSSQSFAATVRALRKKPGDRLRRVVAYTSAMSTALDPILDALRPNAYMIWIVGNRHVGGVEIPTSDMLVELMEGHGARLVTCATRSIAFRRMAARNSISTAIRKEHVLVFRKVCES